MNPSMTLVRLDEPVYEEPADVLSAMPVVSVFDALAEGDLRRAMASAPSFNAEALNDASLDDLMALVTEALSLLPVWEIKFGLGPKHAEEALGPGGPDATEARLALFAAAQRLWQARPANTGPDATVGRRPVVGMRLTVDETTDRPQLRAVPTSGKVSA
jgi:hypothetical protein